MSVKKRFNKGAAKDATSVKKPFMPNDPIRYAPSSRAINDMMYDRELRNIGQKK